MRTVSVVCRLNELVIYELAVCESVILCRVVMFVTSSERHVAAWYIFRNAHRNCAGVKKDAMPSSSCHAESTDVKDDCRTSAPTGIDTFLLLCASSILFTAVECFDNKNVVCENTICSGVYATVSTEQ